MKTKTVNVVYPPDRVTLAMMEFVDCEDCRQHGKWTEVAPNRFVCACGSEVETEPCTCAKGRAKP